MIPPWAPDFSAPWWTRLFLAVFEGARAARGKGPWNMIDRGNKFMVSARGDGAYFVLSLAGHRPFEREDALNIAAWLLAIADTSEPGTLVGAPGDLPAHLSYEFLKLLGEVQES